MRRGRVLPAALLTIVVIVAGCRQAPEAEVEAVAPVTPTPTATPAPQPSPPSESEPDPLAIPDDPATIDEAYLLGVLNTLFAAETARTRHTLTTRQRDDEWQAWLAALYAPQAHDFQVRFFDQLQRNWHIFRPPEEMEEITVAEIAQVITATPDCVFVEAIYRSGAILEGDPEWEPTHVGLVPHLGQADPTRNPTPWVFVQRVTYTEGTEPDNPCL